MSTTQLQTKAHTRPAATQARTCPRCGSASHRTRLPLLLRPLRLLVPSLYFRRCYTCDWRGLAR